MNWESYHPGTNLFMRLFLWGTLENVAATGTAFQFLISYFFFDSWKRSASQVLPFQESMQLQFLICSGSKSPYTWYTARNVYMTQILGNLNA